VKIPMEGLLCGTANSPGNSSSMVCSLETERHSYCARPSSSEGSDVKSFTLENLNKTDYMVLYGLKVAGSVQRVMSGKQPLIPEIKVLDAVVAQSKRL
jgi:hypothetical protein